MTENKRYFTVDYDEEYYIFDSSKITEEEVLEQAEYSYDVFANSLTKDEIVNLLNNYNRLIYVHGLLHDECLELEIKLREAESDVASLEEENEQLQRSGLMAICKEQEKEIANLKKELYEALEEYYYEAYSDNPVRRDEHILYMKKEFKEKYGDVE